mgnify:CR=1 FL=1
MSEIQTIPSSEESASRSLSVFADNDSFELAQRAAKLLAASDLVPQSFRGSIPNCLLALNIAHRLGADPFSVLQNLFVVHGKPSWSASFLIAMVNSSGRFTPLQFRMSGSGDDLTCVAHAKSKETGEPVEGPPVSIRMAKEEGWHGKPGSKWAGAMAPLMLRYRAGAFFSRIYAPDLTLGMRTAEEEMDIQVVNSPAKLFEAAPPKTLPVRPSQPIEITEADLIAALPEDSPLQPEPVEVEVVEPEPEPDPKAEVLTEVLELITNSKAKGADVETVLRRKRILGANGTIAMLGQTKLGLIKADWIEIEAAALNPVEPVPFD